MFDAGGVFPDHHGLEVGNRAHNTSRFPFERGFALTKQSRHIRFDLDKDPVAHLCVDYDCLQPFDFHRGRSGTLPIVKGRFVKPAPLFAALHWSEARLLAFDAHATIYAKICPTHKRGLLRGKEGHHVYDLIDCADAPSRLHFIEDAPGKLRICLARDKLVQHW